MILVCQVTPNARRDECAGWTLDEQGRRVLRVKLAASPVDGEANRALVDFLCRLLGCARKEVFLRRGGTSRVKALEVPDAAAARLDRIS